MRPPHNLMHCKILVTADVATVEGPKAGILVNLIAMRFYEFANLTKHLQPQPNSVQKLYVLIAGAKGKVHC